MKDYLKGDPGTSRFRFTSRGKPSDANVLLYPAPVRDILVQLAVMDLFRAKWSADIHREWIEALLRNEPHRDRAVLERTRDLMDSHTRDCLVTGYERLIPALELADRPIQDGQHR